jgi:uncharacterized protein (DUF2141 family)
VKKLMIALALGATGSAFAAPVPSSPSLGMAEGRCRAGEPGPAFLINVVGLKDRGGTMKAELYPANDTDFLADDNILINAGKTFRRVVIDVPSTGPVQICIRAPSAGAFALALLHDRDSNRKFGLSVDGIGAAGNPTSVTMRQPRASEARAVVGNGVTPVNIRMMYRRGLFSFAPL